MCRAQHFFGALIQPSLATGTQDEPDRPSLDYFVPTKHDHRPNRIPEILIGRPHRRKCLTIRFNGWLHPASRSSLLQLPSDKKDRRSPERMSLRIGPSNLTIRPPARTKRSRIDRREANPLCTAAMLSHMSPFLGILSLLLSIISSHSASASASPMQRASNLQPMGSISAEAWAERERRAASNLRVSEANRLWAQAQQPPARAEQRQQQQRASQARRAGSSHPPSTAASSSSSSGSSSSASTAAKKIVQFSPSTVAEEERRGRIAYARREQEAREEGERSAARQRYAAGVQDLGTGAPAGAWGRSWPGSWGSTPPPTPPSPGPRQGQTQGQSLPVLPRSPFASGGKRRR